ncbi:MAG TPA: homogentisate 1,2-dioxygenase [Candidatus Krumholzibacteria bacterium]|nr:homogentisate 1,2-dioxygenase [Candidatus Krumholzibacteria bacterium]HPD72142.1 homogentisate 1,2-dioxygenase [Candidatus Krumholzibacteria bacterium]HRY40926.1 homogentisate 1,2-dioxygenase [Candidatus Krumholzibacteria bacterium]
MPYYHRLGEVPPKRHTVFAKPGGGIHYEHLMGNLGFTGLQSLLYTLRRPTAVVRTEKVRPRRWDADSDSTLRMRHLRTHRLETPGPSAVTDRIPLLFNHDLALSLARPRADDRFFYRNSQGDEIVFLSRGQGVLESQFGELDVRQGDYVVIPRGIVHRWRLDLRDEPILLCVESRGHVRTPSRYRNEHGQLLEHSPYCERDIRPPSRLVTVDETGEFAVVVKKDNEFHLVTVDHHPCDTVGWDGYYFPWALSIHDFEPITGRLHQPPPVHQTFAGDGWVLCSFVPRLYDYHPQAVPAPYNHSNVMSDEVLYYCNDEFMSRSGIEFGSLTLHPDGLPHGPQPGRTEASIGQKETRELAVMIDAFAPLRVATAALSCEDPEYPRSWLEES